MTSPKTPAHRPTRRPRPQPSQRIERPELSRDLSVDSAESVERSVPAARAMVARPKSEPESARMTPAQRAYVAIGGGSFEGAIQPLRTSFLDTMNKVQAMTAANERLPAPATRRTLAETRGYSRDDLFAIAELAYHYLFSGGTKLALTLWEGLTAVAPDESYFAQGLGLTCDHLGRRDQAIECYHKAAQLDASDARPDINAAELYLLDGHRGKAAKLLERGLAKAQNRGDEDLEKKARAMLAHLSRAA